MTPEQLLAEANRRTEHYHGWTALATLLLQARNGNLPLQGMSAEERYEINLMRTAHDDHVTMASRVFGIDVAPKRGTSSGRESAALVENACRGYEYASIDALGMRHTSLKDYETFYLTLMGESVRLVCIDEERQTPFFHTRDPRTHLPPVGWSPLQGPLPNTMFRYQQPLSSLCALYADNEEMYRRLWVLKDDQQPNKMMDCVEWWSRERWQKIAFDGNDYVTLIDSHGPGHPDVMPVVVSRVFDGETKGRTTLADVLGLQRISTTVLSMTFESLEQMLYPTIIHDPVEGGKLQRGYGKSNVYDQQYLNGRSGRLDKIAPDSPVPMMQITEYVSGHTRSLTRNPESMQGAGPADSAKALAELKSGPSAYIEKNVIGPQLDAEARSYGIAMKIEQAMWGNERKQIPGKSKFYVPNVALQGYENSVVMKPGQGPQTQAGVVMRLQQVGQGYMPRREAWEQDPGILDTDAWEKELDRQKIADGEFQGAVALVQQDPTRFFDLFHKVRQVMDSKDVGFTQAFDQLIESGELQGFTPQQATMPPELAGLMQLGGGQDPMAQGAMPPALSEMRALPAGGA